MRKGLPEKQGLYDPQFEHDNCGVGFVCNIKGEKSNDIVLKGIEILEKMSHRGAVGADPKTGDGAGIQIQLPHDFYDSVCSDIGIKLPASGKYGTGLIFLPIDKDDRKFCQDVFERIIKEEGQTLLGWRDVPVDDSIIGETAKNTRPMIRQVFIGKSAEVDNQLAFERRLYVIRKKIENTIRTERSGQILFFYITNISSRTVSYKGLLMPDQIKDFYPELKDSRVKSAICLVHSRYSTNTFPTWDLAQPFRFLAHNGEINTLRGNINWMKAREGLLKSEIFGEDIENLKPVITPGGSDSSSLDNIFELLVLSGRPLSHSMMMLVPSAWEKDNLLDKELRDFYEYHACVMEPWDGPASIAFTDGVRVGALLDRNGLRPARYVVTKDGLAAMASEAGVLEIEPENILISGRLNPGRMFFINTELGQIMNDRKIRGEIARQHPYNTWLKDNIIGLKDLSKVKKRKKVSKNVLTLLKSFGYTREDMKLIVKSMAENAKEPVGSMGNDTPHAVLSEKPQLIYNYFKQLFAQVTNPPVDPIREELVMSLVTFIGPERNILEATPEHCHRIRVNNPILSDGDLAKLDNINVSGYKTKTLSILFKVSDENNFSRALDRICEEAVSVIKDGYSFIILSDRGTDKDHAAIPALLATGAVHHHLVESAMRTRIGLIVETGEARETHHFNLLFGYGADCVNPYLAYAAIGYLIEEGELSLDINRALQNYSDAVDKGIFKTISKMGISTLRSYRGAQIFEALGISEDVINKCFSGTVSRIGGLSLMDIAKETITRHKEGYPERETGPSQLNTGGVYQWKRDGEFHLWNPETISALQNSVRKEDYSKYKEFSYLINDQSKNPTTLRSLLRFQKTDPIPLDEVEPISGIVKRFASGAMSFGSISKDVHETIAIAMNRLGAKSNTGEGGEDPVRFVPLPNGDSIKSAIKQVASGRFGVTTNYLVNADELQIKIAQGAKPGEGGQLPGHKVSVSIGRTRYTTPGVTLISPPPHHDIYSIEDLAQLIFDLKNVNPYARISVKLVSEAGVGTVAVGVVKGHADMIVIAGFDGGTGASPISSIRHAGLPWELGLSETHQTLVMNGLRSRVRLQTDGQIRTGRDVAIAALLGAEEFGFATPLLVSLGCVMLRHCHLNNCSVGVATQDENLCKRFQGRPEYVINYLSFIARELREIMASLGVRTIDEMIGRTDLLEVNTDIVSEKTKGIDLSRILYKPELCSESVIKQDKAIDRVLDRKLIKLADEAITKGKKVSIDLPIRNSDRATGAMLSGEICRHYGEKGLLENTIHCKFFGIAGQSFGAFLSKGITFELEGISNDYVGKGMSGGKIIIYPKEKTDYKAEENILIGNTTFYGATSGEAYLRGIAGERFCVRNSGIHAVVEGVGDHGCEYMTGGRVIVLGKTGRNFAAGMSGGIAYVYDIDGRFKSKCNTDMVEFDELTEEDRMTIYGLVNNHRKYTQSTVAGEILSDFEGSLKKFIKIIPVEYKSVLESKKAGSRIGLSEVSDG